MTPQKFRLHLTVGILFIISAFLLGLDPLFSQLGVKRYETVAQSMSLSSQQPMHAEAVFGGKPIAVHVPSVGVQKAVMPGYYDAVKQTWTLSDENAHFASMSSQPNTQTGNTFIYGHNTARVFSKLRDLAPGDIAHVTTESGMTFVYRFRDSIEVNPEDTYVLSGTSRPTLSLQTCTGLWYQKRTIYKFDFVEVRSQ